MIFEDVPSQVKAMQAKVRQCGLEIIGLLGGQQPNQGSVRIGPAPCGAGGAYYVTGHWQVNLAPSKQIATLAAIRDTWHAKGITVTDFTEFAPGEARLYAAGDGFSFSLISTTPPTAVSISVGSPCIQPSDGKYPGGLAVYE